MFLNDVRVERAVHGLLQTETAADRSAARILGLDPLAEYPNVDGVLALTHKTGCGMAAGEPLKLLRRTLAGYARHANFSHVIMIGLGHSATRTYYRRNGLTEGAHDQRTLSGRVALADAGRRQCAGRNGVRRRR